MQNVIVPYIFKLRIQLKKSIWSKTNNITVEYKPNFNCNKLNKVIHTAKKPEDTFSSSEFQIKRVLWYILAK